MMSKQQYLAYLDKIWPNDEATKIAKLIVESLSRLNAQELQAITYAALIRYADRKSLSPELQSAVMRLTSSSDALLQPYGIFVDNDGNEFVIKGDSFDDLVVTNTLVHPEDGNLVSNPASKVAPVFEVVNFEAIQA